MKKSLVLARRARMDALPLVLIVLLISLLLFGFVGTAQAAAPGPKLSYAGLMARLKVAPGGKLDAYFLTVLSGDDIVAIDAEVIGYSPVGTWKDALILFQSSDARITKLGGIAAGMSGSPGYAEDGSLIGAVSYGLTYEASPVAGVTPLFVTVRV